MMVYCFIICCLRLTDLGLMSGRCVLAHLRVSDQTGVRDDMSLIDSYSPRCTPDPRATKEEDLQGAVCHCVTDYAEVPWIFGPYRLDTATSLTVSSIRRSHHVSIIDQACCKPPWGSQPVEEVWHLLARKLPYLKQRPSSRANAAIHIDNFPEAIT